MAGKRIVIPNYMPALDITGGPVSGAMLYFYENGTTTLKSTYTSAALTTAHPNPVVADAAGVFASVFADEDEEFSVAITDSSGAPIGGLRNRDNVTPSLVYGAGVAESAAEIPYLASGTGALERPTGEKLADTISVFDFIPESLRPAILANTSTTSVSAYVQSAVTAANGRTLDFPGGTYVFTTPVLMAGLSNVLIRGAGATIKGNTTRFQSYFNISGATGITFDGLKFDQMMSSLPTYVAADLLAIYNCPIYGNTGYDNIVVRNCEFVNLYTTAIWGYTGGSLTVDRCKFSSPLQTNDQQCSHIYLQTVGPEIKITNCRFENAVTTRTDLSPNAIFISGVVGRAYVQDNYFNYCGRSASLDVAHNHRLAAIDFYADVENVFVRGNIADNCMAQFMRLSSCHTGRVSKNHVTVSANAEVGYSTLTLEGIVAGAKKGIRDITVEDNIFIDLSGRAAFTVGVLAYDWGAPSTDIQVSGNRFLGCKTSVLTSGPFYNVSITTNKSRLGPGTIDILLGSGLTTIEGTEANAVFDILRVNDNTSYNPTSGDTTNGFISRLNTATTAYVGYQEVCRNHFRGNGNLGVGITLFGYSSSPANNRILCDDNQVSGFAYGYYVRDTGEVMLRRNRARGIGITPLIGGTDSILLVKRDNRWASGILSGTATLVAGTVTVSNTEILAGDTVNLSRKTVGGTAGYLSLGTITASTSFVISSSSASDTSVVFWEITH